MMDAKTHERLRARPAAEICRECDLETDVSQWLRAEPDAAAVLQQLLAAGAQKDAVRFLGHALEPREVVWWAWDCVAAIDAAALLPEETAALASTSTWLDDPVDKNRRAAQAAADRCGVDKAAGCVALAVFLAEGSLGPPDLAQEVPPPPFSCAKAGVGAILLLAVKEPRAAAERAAQCIERWFALAATPPPWTRRVEPPIESGPDDYDTKRKL